MEIRTSEPGWYIPLEVIVRREGKSGSSFVVRATLFLTLALSTEQEALNS